MTGAPDPTKALAGGGAAGQEMVPSLPLNSALPPPPRPGRNRLGKGYYGRRGGEGDRVKTEGGCVTKLRPRAGDRGCSLRVLSPLPWGIAHHFGGWLWIRPSLPRPGIAAASAETEEDSEPGEVARRPRKGGGPRADPSEAREEGGRWATLWPSDVKPLWLVDTRLAFL